MKNRTNFEVFIILSAKKIKLSVNRKFGSDLIFQKETFFENNSTALNFEKLDFFLEENILKVEKILGSFIESVNIIINSRDFFNLQISVKKNDYNEKINTHILNYLIKDAKNQCEKTIKNMRIIHILIDKYLIDENHFLDPPINQKCKNFSLDIRFICLPKEVIKKIEKKLKSYHISINQILNADYVYKCSNSANIPFVEMASKIIDGHNKNEVKLVNKKQKNSGFFEKFFNLFS